LDIEVLHGIAKQGFAILKDARARALEFVDWYNNLHCHNNASKLITLAQRH